MIRPQRTILTGGSGLLGRAIRALLTGIAAPSSAEFDVREYESMARFASAAAYELLIHAAAFTSPPRVEQDPMRAVEVNIAGTANVVRLCAAFGLRLAYVSTDYVFRGDRGGYAEEDPLHPVNRYAWSKLGGECAVRLLDDSLIVRTSFGPEVFPYPAAFADQWTSRLPVGEAARRIVSAIDRGLTGIVHVGGPRRTVLEYARSLGGTREIRPMSVHEATFAAPVDTSLDTSRYRAEVEDADKPSPCRHGEDASQAGKENA